VNEIPQVSGDLVDHVQVEDHAEHHECDHDEHERERREHDPPEPDNHCHGDSAEEKDCLFVAGMKKMGGHDALPVSVDDLTTSRAQARRPAEVSRAWRQRLLPKR